MISVVIPSRDRPDELKTALDSLDHVKHELEVLVWLDTDDPKLKRYKELFGKDPNIKLFVKERVGYIGSHIMLNFLVSQVSFDWIFQWNDDAIMVNPDWFQIFKDFVEQFDPINQPVVLNIWGQGETVFNLFPIVSRAYFDILGHYSGATTCDEWVRMVAIGANISYNLKGIKPKHRKYGGEDPLRDETFQEVEKDRQKVHKIWNERRKMLPKDRLNADINKLVDYENDRKAKQKVS